MWDIAYYINFLMSNYVICKHKEFQSWDYLKTSTFLTLNMFLSIHLFLPGYGVPDRQRKKTEQMRRVAFSPLET